MAGAGGTFDMSMVINAEFSRRGYPSLGGNMTVHSDIVAHYLLNHGTEEQKQHYLPGSWLAATVSAPWP